ncbi:MAG TPA: Na/Pi cotransporter family protein [Alphaproteobacteria bacterium]
MFGISATAILVTLLGGVALTLYGVNVTRDEVIHAFGPRLRLMIERSTRNRFQAFGAGIAVTSLTQSATATALMITSFASRGLIPLMPALAMLLGADVGTTIVAQIFSLKIYGVAPIIILIGFVGMRWRPLGSVHHMFHALIGLGLMMLGVATITNAALPMEQAPLIRDILHSLDRDVMMAALIAVILTWMAHSTLAIVLLIMSFTVAGAMTLTTAFAMVLGAHCGAAITPLLLHLHDRGTARQISWGGFILRGSVAFALVPFATLMASYADLFSQDTGRQVVNFHTGVSVLRALMFLPFLGMISKMIAKMMPSGNDPHDASQANYLHEADLAYPGRALAGASREIGRLGDLVQQMLEDTIHVLRENDQKAIHMLQQRDNAVDKLYEQIKFYLIRLSQSPLNPQDAQHQLDMLMFATDLEHSGDIIVKSLCPLAEKKRRENLVFSQEGWNEILQYHQLVLENFRLAMQVFATQNIELARQLVAQKEMLQESTHNTSGLHFARIRSGQLESVRSSSLHLDIIRDFRRINSHANSIAYMLLQHNGNLQSRIRTE